MTIECGWVSKVREPQPPDIDALVWRLICADTHGDHGKAFLIRYELSQMGVALREQKDGIHWYMVRGHV